jgi:protoporphyrinogen oxidase
VELACAPTDHSASRYDAIVIGAGMAGLAAAEALRSMGLTVRVLEADQAVGGLSRSVFVGGEQVEAYYHHIFPQDRETIDLVHRLGMAGQLEWRRAPMAILHAGSTHRFDSPSDLLSFSPLGVADRVRVGIATSVQLLRRDHATLDRRPAAADAARWFGRPAADLLWRPLLAAKFGPDYSDRVAMAWLVARMRQRARARRARGDRLGYVRGSLGAVAGAFADGIRASGVEIETSARVVGLLRAGNEWLVDVEQGHDRRRYRAATVVAAMAGPVLKGLVELPQDYRSMLDAIPYRGVVCALLELERPLSPYYWINVTDSVGLGCVAIIEHTNLVPPARYQGRSLLYLAHYAQPGEPAWHATPEDLAASVATTLRSIRPGFRTSWIRAVSASRDRYAQPVPLVGGPMPRLPVATGLPGLYHASLAHIYPDDRGISMAINLGRRAAGLAAGQLARSGP